MHLAVPGTIPRNGGSLQDGKHGHPTAGATESCNLEPNSIFCLLCTPQPRRFAWRKNIRASLALPTTKSVGNDKGGRRVVQLQSAVGWLSDATTTRRQPNHLAGALCKMQVANTPQSSIEVPSIPYHLLQLQLDSAVTVRIERATTGRLISTKYHPPVPTTVMAPAEIVVCTRHILSTLTPCTPCTPCM
jgi:hypothetical protein